MTNPNNPATLYFQTLTTPSRLPVSSTRVGKSSHPMHVMASTWLAEGGTGPFCTDAGVAWLYLEQEAKRLTCVLPVGP